MKLRLLIMMMGLSGLAFLPIDQAQAKSRPEKRARIQSNSYKAKVKRRVHKHYAKKPVQTVQHRRSYRHVRPVYRPVKRRVYRRHVHYRPTYHRVIRPAHVHYIDDGCYDDGSDVYWNLHIGTSGVGIHIGH
ncbi:MAG TPA: hypothetical protein PKC21_09980 [Oligoflexia bacterium]|nr:hypothetical protein [Oligoflexia bacterium]HMR25668.1 hypothetical protein [Oligoflexia bacterium]